MFISKTMRAVFVLCLSLLCASGLVGCGDDAGGLGTSNTISLTFEGDKISYGSVAARPGDTRRITHGTIFQFAIAGASFTGKSIVPDEKVTIRVNLAIEPGESLEGKSFALDANTNVIMLDDFNRTMSYVQSQSGTLTIDAIEFDDQEGFNAADDPASWVKTSQIHKIKFHFEGSFARFDHEQHYDITGKVNFVE